MDKTTWTSEATIEANAVTDGLRLSLISLALGLYVFLVALVQKHGRKSATYSL
jgi:hypothetical protein